jgi:hypothetical protein
MPVILRVWVGSGYVRRENLLFEVPKKEWVYEL